MMLKKFSYIPRFFFAIEAAKSVPGKALILSQATSHQPLPITSQEDMLVPCLPQHLKTKPSTSSLRT